LELAFATKSLRQLCESTAKAKKVLGEEVAEMLKRRLADLRAAEYVNDLVVGKPHAFDDTNGEKFSVNLCDDFCIIFRANHTPPPLTECSKINWSKVSRIHILQIGNKHDK